MPDGDAREAALTADYNAEMIEHIAAHPRVRDRSIFVGDPDDIVPEHVRTGAAVDPRVDRAPLQTSRLHHRLRPRRLGDRDALRAELGYGDDEQVCIVTVGGSGVGADCCGG